MSDAEKAAAKAAADKAAADKAAADKAAADKAAAEAATKSQAAVKHKAARVLLAFGEHQPNDVVELTADELDTLKAEGHVDDHPAAVAYARSLRNAG